MNRITLELQRLENLFLERRIWRPAGLDRNIEDSMLGQIEKGLQCVQAAGRPSIDGNVFRVE